MARAVQTPSQADASIADLAVLATSFRRSLQVQVARIPRRCSLNSSTNLIRLRA
jgi:hypothetical protein